MTTTELLNSLGFRPAADIGITVTEDAHTYRIKGTTDDITTCDCCGRTGLKKTVILAVLDADGNQEDQTYYGTACAAKATRQTTTAIRNAASTADTNNAEARRWAAEFANLPLATYLNANRRAGTVDELTARWARTTAEARRILAGDITGTRFDR